MRAPVKPAWEIGAFCFLMVAFSLIDLLALKGMMSAALLFAAGIFMVPYYFIRKIKLTAMLYLISIIMVVAIEKFSEPFIDNNVKKSAYDFRDEINMIHKATGGYPSNSDKYKKRFWMEYPIRFRVKEDGSPEISMDLFNYKLQYLDVVTGDLGVPFPDPDY